MEYNYTCKKIEIGLIDISVPIIELGDIDSKNKIAISCCVHGNETTSLFIMEKLIDLLIKSDFQSYVKFIPFSNPLAVFSKQRESFTDKQDMNRIAPGKNNGTISEVICDTIISEISSCDYYIDLHQWDIPTLIQSILMKDTTEEVRKKSREMVNVFSPDVISELQGEYTSSLCGYITIKKRIPGFAVEIPNMDLCGEEKFERIIMSLFSVIKSLSCIENMESNNTDNQYIQISDYFTKRSDDSGLFFPLCKIGDCVDKEQPIGYIVQKDFLRRKIIKSDYTGVLMQLSNKKYINCGELLYAIIN